MTSRTPSVRASRTRSPRTRTLLALAAAGPVGLCWLVASASPALAVEGLGERTDSGLTALQTFTLFVGIPALVVGIVFALVYGLSRNNEPRLREGQAWWSEPEYFSKDGSSADGAAAEAAASDPPRTTDGGGTGARW